MYDERMLKKDGEVDTTPIGKKFVKDNWMKAAFINSDRNITVSMNYAKEISGSASKGVELNTIINATGGIEGIVNGMDPTEWNPATDKFLDITYDSTRWHGQGGGEAGAPGGGLPRPSAPIFGYIGRLEEQKGCDIMMRPCPSSSSSAPTRRWSSSARGRSPWRRRSSASTSSPNMAGVQVLQPHRALLAGADFLMVPSRFEPCGLIQLHAMQYGTVPIVASTAASSTP